jgi:hypothetical protein
MEYGNGAHTLIGVGGTVDASLSPGATAVTFNLTGILSTFDISSQSGAAVTVNNEVDVANALNLSTDGGSIILTSSVLSAAALGNVDVSISNGGAFSVGGSLLTADVISGGTITYGSGGGTSVVGTANSFITLDLASSFSPYVGFTATSDIIDDLSLKYTGSTSYTITGTGSGTQTITIAQNGETLEFQTTDAHLTDVTNHTGLTDGPLKLTEDANGGTEITVCFARGTRIATPAGYRAVETLDVGDLVTVLRDGGPACEPIKWLGQRRITLAAHPRPEMVAPIRIRQGAFSDRVPSEDLLVSPDHALFVDDALICARQLVNGMTILQEDDLGQVDYFHIELERHGILLAEGLPTESYLDTGNRGFFANARGAFDLYPNLYDDSDNPARETGSCAPFVWDETHVKPVWDRLAERAATMGRKVRKRDLSADPDLYLVINRRMRRPLDVHDGHYTFVLPKGATEIRIVSHAASPTDTRPWLDDRRRLGVSVERITLRNGADMRDIPIDHPGLSQGWWAVEHHGDALRRWTNGDARVSLPVIAGAAILDIQAATCGMTYAVGQRRGA